MDAGPALFAAISATKSQIELIMPPRDTAVSDQKLFSFSKIDLDSRCPLYFSTISPKVKYDYNFT
ncbi:hypothetical protein PH210_14750 [Paenibacillus sp. BSR1-1]|uniref:hypothetical protein n=1 Tax=Paenibacillus sp. BSR1-1 TaxID=3020845 RepID=UPI0025AFDCFC|nr:hypothetical protein [Paenibacillus sp. BSR1-1]MDN3017454.1 hypothetical protein [Paenibacillus sp. BSR1-1]